MDVISQFNVINHKALTDCVIITQGFNVSYSLRNADFMQNLCIDSNALISTEINQKLSVSYNKLEFFS